MTRFATYFIVLAVFVTGCASTQTATLERRLRTLEDENFRLRQSMLDREEAPAEEEPAAPTAPTERADAQPTPAPAPVVAQVEQAEERSAPAPVAQREEELAPSPFTAPERTVREQPIPRVAPQPVAVPPRPPMGPPQHWARAYRPPEVPGCESGPLSVRVTNFTEAYIELYIDGVRARVFGGAGTLPHIPPGQRVFMCHDGSEMHTIMGQAFYRRGAELVPGPRFSFSQRFSMSRDRAQAVHITSRTLRTR